MTCCRIINLFLSGCFRRLKERLFYPFVFIIKNKPQSISRPFLIIVSLIVFSTFFFTGTSFGNVVISAHTDNPDPVAAHGIVTYTIVVSNNDLGSGVSNVTLTDTLPASTLFVDITPPAGVTCGGVAVGGTGTLTCTGLSLAAAGNAGDSATFTVRVRTTAASRTAGTITNSATVNDGVNPPFTQDQTTTVNPGSDVALTKSGSPSPVVAGGVVSYTYSLTNNGPDDASSLVITDSLPPNCLITGGLPAGCSAVGQAVTCNVANLANGATTNVTPIRCIAGVAGGSTLTNTASVSVGAASPDNLTANNTSTVNIPVTAGTDVSLVKTKSLASVFVGDSFNFVLTPQYSGDFPAGATMTDVVPAQFTITSPAAFSQSGWNCTVSVQTVSCTRSGSGSAGVNQALGVVNIGVTATAAGSFSNSASIAAPAGITDPTPGNNSSTLVFTVAPLESNFSSTKTRTVPNAVPQNAPFDYTLAARNNGPSAFTGTVTLTDTLPAGFTLNSYGAASGFAAAGCTPAAASLPVAGPVTITCSRTVTNLAANTSAGSIVINVTPTGTGTLSNTVCVSTPVGGPPDLTPGNDCATNVVDSQINTDQADLRVNKTASPATVAAGQQLTYTVEVVNAGPQTAQNALVTDALSDLINGTIGAGQGVEAQPVIVPWAATIPASGSAACRIVSTGGTSAQLNCTITTLPVCTAGVDCPTFTFIIRPAASANPDNADVSRTNTASVLSQVTADPNLGNNSGSVTTNVSPRVDMTVTKTDTPDPVSAGQNLTYTITARNNGPSRASGVSITDTLPNDVTFISATASNSGTCTTTPTVNSTTGPGNNTLICSWGTQFNANVQRTVTVTVRPNYVTHGTTLTNSVIVYTTTTPDTNPANDTATATTNVSNPVYDLLINKVDSPDPITVGDDVTYTVTVTNNGASFAENIRVVDTLSAAGLSYRSFTPITAGVSCSTTATVGVIGGTVTCDISGLASHSTAQFQVVLRGETKGTYNNVAVVRFQDPTADAYDPQANNTVTEPTTVRTRSDVQVVSKQAVQTGTATPLAQIEFRRPFDWLVSIQNNGPAEADTVTFADTLPAGMELTGTPVFTVTSGSFTPAAPTCTGSAGVTSFSCSITSMPANGTATVRIPVRVITVPGGGTTTNTATIVTTGSFDTNGGSNPNAGNNFGSGSITVLSSSMAGRVYRDNNDNGVVDAGETGISGATIAVTGNAFDGTAVNRTTTTDGSGNFSFAGLPESNGTGYTLTETNGNLPVGYVDGKDSLSGSAIGTVGNDVFTGIVLAGNTALSGYLFGETPGVTISGSVLNDTDASHTSNAGDTPISGVTMTLNGTNDRGQPVNCFLTTDAGGAFSFTAANCTNLRAGNATGYTLTETQPTGYLPGYTLVGTATGIGSSSGTLSGGVTGNTIVGILLPPGGTSTNNIFLEVRPTTIGGSVYLDFNGNAVRDGSETVGIPSVTIVLSGTNDLSQTINCTITTGSGGSYQFPNVADTNPLCQTIRPGTYILTETKPVGLTSTGAQPGTPINGTASSTATTQVVSSIIITGAGAVLTNYNFGHQGATGLGGSVYIDTNNNGVRDPGEQGIPGVAVTLSGTAAVGGSVCSYISSCTVITDANGYYSFITIPGSDGTGYTLTERDGSGTASPILSNYADGIDSAGTVNGVVRGTAGNDTISAISITTGEVGVDYRFGERGGSITGRVYLDANDNGVYDGGDTGIAGVTITLSGTTSSSDNICTVMASVYPTCSVTTLADGSYSFTGLPASNGTGYTLTETQPVDYANRTTTAGTAGGAVTGTTITGIVLGAGSSATGYLFGEKTGSINGFVYHDANDDGIKDAGEPGISGVTLTLSGTTVSGVPVNQTTTTDADGRYSFTGLRNANPSGYTITETQPVGYLDGKETAGTQGGTVDNTGFDATAARNRISAIPFSAAALATGYNFGEVLSGSISGRIYYDFNNNSSYDAGEELTGVIVTLTGIDDQGTAVSLSTTTAVDGKYSFSNLRPSNGAGYTLTETQPTGIGDFPGTAGTQVGTINGTPTGTAALNQISGIVLSSGTSGINYNFRENASSLSGFVYLDANNNGLMDGGETGIGGVTIALSGSTNSITITAADGSYRFVGLINGTYTLTETQPVMYQDGRETAGTAGGTVDNSIFTSDPAQNRISAITLPMGTAGSGYLFGERTGLTGSFSGKVWYNSILRDQTQQLGEPGMAGWRVEVKLGGVVQGSTVTVADGTWMVSGLAAATGYEIVFRHPSNNAIYGIPVSQDPGYHDSVPDYSAKTIANMVLRSGGNVINQNLPIDPSGVVYDSITRLPVAGAIVAIAGPPGFNAATQLAGGLANQSQVTNATGFYQFLLLTGAPSGQYTISITPPAGYIPGPSVIIPPTAGPYIVPGGPPVAIQTQPTPPTGAQPTTYYFIFTMSGTSSVVNNHIPVDPILGGAIIAMKNTPLVNVKRGDLVPYTITMTNTLTATVTNIDVRDLMPPGFKYRTGSGTLNGVHTEPLIAGRQLTWRNLTFTTGEKKTFMMILVVGSGVAEGEYINQVYAANNIVNTAVSNIATATVRVIPDPTFDCPDVIGKVFDDKNANGYQDEGEPGIANVRLATARGLIVTTDAEGRFHIPCPEVPNEDRGSNFIIKIDERTLPSGFRLTTENPLVVRLTRGKMTKMNFGATIHRVIRIDVNDAAFAKDDTKLREEWRQKIQALEKQLQEKSSVVRIAYRMGAEPKKLVDGRIKAIREMLQALWKKGKDCPPLVFEEEIVEVR